MSGREDRDAFILRRLAESMGEVVSGEELAALLGISRVALKKRVDRMVERGIPIEAVERKGYRLLEIPDTPLEEVVLSLLDTEVVGSRFIFYPVVDSTNRVARELAREGCPEGTVVVADKQTAGRGRLGRRWFSPEGRNLYFSVVLRPRISPTYLYHATMLAAVSVCEALRNRGIDALIKWPNDVYVRGRKICGVLNEAELSGSRAEFVVLGVGVNVNIESGEFPPDVRDIATSLFEETGERHKRSELLAEILSSMDRWYKKLRRGDVWELFSFWRRNNYLIGRRIEVDGRLKGDAVGITPLGELIVRVEDGSITTVAAGDIKLLEKT